MLDQTKTKKAVSRKRKKRSTAKTEPQNFLVDSSDRTLVLKIAKRYKQLAKGHSSYARPWRIDTPVEEQPVVLHFVKFLSLARGLGADPMEMLQAQFSQFWVPNRYPFPSQLHTPKAIDRWNTHLCEKADTAQVKGRVNGRIQDFEADEEKLRLLQLRSKLSDRKLLKLRALEFSREYLEHRGVWDSVSEEWLDAWEGDE